MTKAVTLGQTTAASPAAQEDVSTGTRPDDVRFPARMLESIADSTADGILVVGRDARMVYFNKRFVDMWQLPPEIVARSNNDEAIAWVRGQLADPDAFVARVAYLDQHPTDIGLDELRLTDGRILERRNAPLLVDDGNPVGRILFFRDVTEERRAKAASDLLALSGELFASPMDMEKTLSQLAELVVPLVADWAAVDVVDEHFTFLRQGVAHVRPGGADLLRALHDEYPLRANEGHLRGRVLATLEPIALYDVDEPELRTLARDERHFEMLRALGLRSAMWIPLIVRGRVLGVLSVGYGDGPRRYVPADLALLRELARRAALALDNALLYRVVQRAETRQAALATLGQNALGGMEYDELTQAAAASVARVMDVPFVEVLDLGPGPQELLLVAGVGWQEGSVGKRTVPAGFGSQGGYTLTTVGPVIVDDLRTEQRFSLPGLLTDHSVVSGVTVIIGSPANPYGVLGAHTDRGRVFADDDVNFLQAVANVLAATRERQEDDARLAALANSELARAAQLKGVIESIGDAVVVCDPAGSVVLSNPAADVLLGERLGDGLTGIMNAFAWPSGEVVELPPGEGVELCLINAERERWIELSAFPILAGENMATADGTILVMRDVTAARNGRAVRDAFLGVLSHELRTPVTAIYGISEVLARESLSALPEASRSELFDDIRSEADRLYRLVENLLVISRVERQGLSIETEPVLIQRLIPRVIESEAARWPDASWRTELPADLPPVAAEETYIEQVLRNLLSNAAKYGGNGPVSVTAEEGEAAVIIRVRDAGPGFEPDEVERLFDLFYRSPAATRRASGAGIGLFVSRQLIEAMGGRLRATNLAEGGAEFAFEIPVFA